MAPSCACRSRRLLADRSTFHTPQKNKCSAEHKAILNANLRREGYIASGVGAVLCARHALVRKTAVGDIPNGEKYVICPFARPTQ